MRVLVMARLLECGSSVRIADGSVGAGPEQFRERFGVTEIDGCGVHEHQRRVSYPNAFRRLHLATGINQSLKGSRGTSKGDGDTDGIVAGRGPW